MKDRDVSREIRKFWADQLHLLHANKRRKKEQGTGRRQMQCGRGLREQSKGTTRPGKKTAAILINFPHL